MAKILWFVFASAFAQKVGVPYPVGLVVEFAKSASDKNRDALHAALKTKLKHRFPTKAIDSVFPVAAFTESSLETLCKEYLTHKEVVACHINRQVVLH